MFKLRLSKLNLGGNLWHLLIDNRSFGPFFVLCSPPEASFEFCVAVPKAGSDAIMESRVNSEVVFACCCRAMRARVT